MLGDIPALEVVKALIMFFKEYFYRYKASPVQKEIAAKAACYITEAPPAGDYI